MKASKALRSLNNLTFDEFSRLNPSETVRTMECSVETFDGKTTGKGKLITTQGDIWLLKVIDGRHSYSLRTPTYSGTGKYDVVYLNGKQCYVHDLVLFFFAGPKPKGMWVDHLDRNSQNNNLSNLRYVTPSENAKNCERTPRQMTEIIASHPIKGTRVFKGQTQAAAALGIAQPSVANCLRNTANNKTAGWTFTRGKKIEPKSKAKDANASSNVQALGVKVRTRKAK